MVASTSTQSSPEPSSAEVRPPKAVETLNITSGKLLLIDQFMLGNPQFVEKIAAASGDAAEAATNYGGLTLDFPKGEYAVFRDPRKTIIAVVPKANASELSDEESDVLLDEIIAETSEEKSAGSVFVDTRCLVLVDVSILNDAEAMSSLKELRDSGEDKKARDFVRKSGGAVRYGFNRYGDELGVCFLGKRQTLALWPDISES